MSNLWLPLVFPCLKINRSYLALRWRARIAEYLYTVRNISSKITHRNVSVTCPYNFLLSMKSGSTCRTPCILSMVPFSTTKSRDARYKVSLLLGEVFLNTLFKKKRLIKHFVCTNTLPFVTHS